MPKATLLTPVPRPLVLRALRPFVEAVKALPDYTPDAAPITLTVGDCRTLAALHDTLEDTPAPSSPKVHPKAERFIASVGEERP